MGKPVLLYVWFSFPRVYHPCDIVFSDFNRDGIFPVMWRGKFMLCYEFLLYVLWYYALLLSYSLCCC